MAPNRFIAMPQNTPGTWQEALLLFMAALVHGANFYQQKTYLFVPYGTDHNQNVPCPWQRPKSKRSSSMAV
jgi:hypothetical protein